MGLGGMDIYRVESRDRCRSTVALYGEKRFPVYNRMVAKQKMNDVHKIMNEERYTYKVEVVEKGSDRSESFHG